MPRFDNQYFQALTETIAAIEERTSAEIVVAVEGRSGNYRDVDFAVGAAAALLGLLAAHFSPWAHPIGLVVVDMVVAFAAAAWLSSALPPVRRFLTSARRRDAQVEQGAGALFYQADVWTTRARTGVLIYLSVLERQALVLADRGITQAVNPGSWNDCLAHFHAVPRAADPPKELLHALEQLAVVLAAALPPSEDNPDELPNAPRGRR